MDEWEIREDERKKIMGDLTQHVAIGGGYNIDLHSINAIIQKRRELGPPAKAIEPIRGYMVDRKTGPNDGLWCGKINELIVAVNELNSVIRTVKA